MSKMTTEQFLSHLGIEVEQEFRIEEYQHTEKYKFDVNFNLLGDYSEGWEASSLSIGDLLNVEITPLPKYTLTEDEKAIVRCLDSVYEAISVNVNGGIHIYMDWPPCSSDKGTYLPISLGYFNFIDRDDLPVSLDELRKCL